MTTFPSKLQRAKFKASYTLKTTFDEMPLHKLRNSQLDPWRKVLLEKLKLHS
jgi:hypothetical protein